ncbi:MAG: acetamidase/formamidase family protein [Phycisphaerales bacterium]|nr:acetamidase/formamidase family protein [Phycisphaerales bacterium]
MGARAADVDDGAAAKVEPRDAVSDIGPCLCGPVAVRGARPGDTLEIAIEEVQPGPWGWTYAARGIATNQLGQTAPLRPFLGTVGLAPRAGEQVCPWTPRGSGGNMDCRELVAGTVLYLPVMAEGGLLSVGDGHAAQGDGELSGTAIECAMEEARGAAHAAAGCGGGRAAGEDEAKLQGKSPGWWAGALGCD